MSLRKPGVYLCTRNNLLFVGKWAETLCWHVKGYPYLKVKHWFQWESPPWRWESHSGPSPRRLSPSPVLQGSPAGKTWLVGALGSSCGHQSSPPHIWFPSAQGAGSVQRAGPRRRTGGGSSPPCCPAAPAEPSCCRSGSHRPGPAGWSAPGPSPRRTSTSARPAGPCYCPWSAGTPASSSWSSPGTGRPSGGCPSPAAPRRCGWRRAGCASSSPALSAPTRRPRAAAAPPPRGPTSYCRARTSSHENPSLPGSRPPLAPGCAPAPAPPGGAFAPRPSRAPGRPGLPQPLPGCRASGTARHGTAGPGTARHGSAQPIRWSQAERASGEPGRHVHIRGDAHACSLIPG